ncbi:hypothetical protein P171DRAFT_29005 [Karstenula rhodostoma CBS 690.94]|uniref:Uncharacterized protein n=1 Tax=Karstenula rhodostoma CBS 690.94 TaxID=1392251 RepID=A0A9P4UCD4_9PLEO|nr:hypothetical protein P171DRAFT_29005 [Karstenula rhodostoma CBS 690.94]
MLSRIFRGTWFGGNIEVSLGVGPVLNVEDVFECSDGTVVDKNGLHYYCCTTVTRKAMGTQRITTASLRTAKRKPGTDLVQTEAIEEVAAAVATMWLPSRTRVYRGSRRFLWLGNGCIDFAHETQVGQDVEPVVSGTRLLDQANSWSSEGALVRPSPLVARQTIWLRKRICMTRPRASVLSL